MQLLQELLAPPWALVQLTPQIRVHGVGQPNYYDAQPNGYDGYDGDPTMTPATVATPITTTTTMVSTKITTMDTTATTKKSPVVVLEARSHYSFDFGPRWRGIRWLPLPK